MTARGWLTAAVALWVAAFGLALLGFALDADALRGLGLLLRRVAAAATVGWAVVAGAAALRRRVFRR